MTAILTSPERLRQIEQDYLGVADDDREGQGAELSWLDGQITQLRGRMTSQVAALIRGGLDEQVVNAAVAQLEDELGLLDQCRSALARLVAEGESARERVSSLDQVATSRLALMSLEERRDLLRCWTSR